MYSSSFNADVNAMRYRCPFGFRANAIAALCISFFCLVLSEEGRRHRINCHLQDPEGCPKVGLQMGPDTSHLSACTWVCIFIMSFSVVCINIFVVVILCGVHGVDLDWDSDSSANKGIVPTTFDACDLTGLMPWSLTPLGVRIEPSAE